MRWFGRLLSNLVAIGMLSLVALIVAAEIHDGFSDGYAVPILGTTLILLPGVIVIWLLRHLSRD